MVGRLLKIGLLLAVACLAGCREAGDKPYHEEAYVFGTLVSFDIVGVPESQARKAVRDVSAEFQHMHKDWHAWKEGELTEVNQALARGESIEVSDFVLPMLKQAKELYHRSDGYFNPAIGAIIGAWGFHSDELPKGAMPSLTHIAELAARAPSMDDVTINGRKVSSTNTAVQFDFGGFGKGAALDRAEEVLVKHGVRNAIVNAGGDLNTLGHPAERPWKIAIRDPVKWGVIAYVELEDGEDVYTSGNYERYYEHEGVKYSHIINPKTGMPVGNIISSTVVHKGGLVADAAATALTVSGPDGWYDVARKMGIKYVLLIDDKGTVYMNPEMQKRVRFVEKEPTHVVLSKPLIAMASEGL